MVFLQLRTANRPRSLHHPCLPNPPQYRLANRYGVRLLAPLQFCRQSIGADAINNSGKDVRCWPIPLHN